MYLLLFFIFNILIINAQVDHDINGNEVAVFVNVPPNSRYHSSQLNAFRRHIVMQLPANQPPTLYYSKNDIESLQQHLILPALYAYRKDFVQYKWVLFVQDITRLELKQLYQMLSELDFRQPEMLGSSMKDYDRTIIHHFDKPYAIQYPHREIGFAMSIGLVNKIVDALEKLAKDPEKYDTHVDPSYELVKFIRSKVQPHFTMLNSTEFCLSNEPGEHCAVWLHPDAILPDCGGSIKDDEILVAVKTCKKFFFSRIPIIKRLWVPDVKNILYFADVPDTKIPTISVNVSNTDTGHCSKFQQILKFVSTDVRWNKFKYVVIVDDDTLISIPRLKKMLYCYNKDEFVALGEKYAYMSWFDSGYDYLTGGSGIVLSMPVISRIAPISFCQSTDWPDDMTLGIWLDNINQSVTHSHLFHQARPQDYSYQRLRTTMPISFHKFWNTNPDYIWQTYLNTTGPPLDGFLIIGDDESDAVDSHLLREDL